jgi:hypothetical protein
VTARSLPYARWLSPLMIFTGSAHYFGGVTDTACIIIEMLVFYIISQGLVIDLLFRAFIAARFALILAMTLLVLAGR